MRFYNQSRFSVPSAWETWATHARSQTALSYLKVEGLHVKYGGLLHHFTVTIQSILYVSFIVACVQNPMQWDLERTTDRPPPSSQTTLSHSTALFFILKLPWLTGTHSFQMFSQRQIYVKKTFKYKIPFLYMICLLSLISEVPRVSSG